MGLSEADQQLAHLSGLLHDIGKVGLPAGILEKTGPLTLEERRVMEEHSVIGDRILSNVAQYGELAKIVRHHHERVDGNGYPDRIEDARIPLISKIIAVADAYNAMTSDRAYRAAMTTERDADDLTADTNGLESAPEGDETTDPSVSNTACAQGDIFSDSEPGR